MSQRYFARKPRRTGNHSNRQSCLFWSGITSRAVRQEKARDTPHLHFESHKNTPASPRHLGQLSSSEWSSQSTIPSQLGPRNRCHRPSHVDNRTSRTCSVGHTSSHVDRKHVCWHGTSRCHNLVHPNHRCTAIRHLQGRKTALRKTHRYRAEFTYRMFPPLFGSTNFHRDIRLGRLDNPLSWSAQDMTLRRSCLRNR